MCGGAGGCCPTPCCQQPIVMTACLCSTGPPPCGSNNVRTLTFKCLQLANPGCCPPSCLPRGCPPPSNCCPMPRCCPPPSCCPPPCCSRGHH